MSWDEINPSSIVIPKEAVIKEGWLLKQSRYLKDWRRRWIVLTPSYLCSFKSKEISYQSPTEALRLKDCSTVKSADDDFQAAYVFRVDTPLRSFLLAAETNADKESWIGHIGRQMVRPSVMKDYSDDELYG